MADSNLVREIELNTIVEFEDDGKTIKRIIIPVNEMIIDVNVNEAEVRITSKPKETYKMRRMTNGRTR